jgi:hypothetical protein
MRFILSLVQYPSYATAVQCVLWLYEVGPMQGDCRVASDAPAFGETIGDGLIDVYRRNDRGCRPRRLDAARGAFRCIVILANRMFVGAFGVAHPSGFNPAGCFGFGRHTASTAGPCIAGRPAS